MVRREPAGGDSVGVCHGQAQISGRARDGQAQAIRFSNTETFSRPVSLDRLRILGDQHGAAVIPYSPRLIPRSLFAAVYQEGQVTS